jgi:hypothetical protein
MAKLSRARAAFLLMSALSVAVTATWIGLIAYGIAWALGRLMSS